MIMTMQKEAFMEWLSSTVPEYVFSQIAAQALFQCQDCGECCRGEGYALIDEDDLQAIARGLGISPSKARHRFTDPDPQDNFACRILKSVGRDDSCCFLDGSGERCRIYQSRPRICRTFPMLSADPREGQAICFYPDCLGTDRFVKMLLGRRDDPEVKKDIKRLEQDDDGRDDLKIRLFLWLQMLLGEEKGAKQISRITSIDLPEQKGAFERDCLAYFFLTISTDGLDDYRYIGRPAERICGRKCGRN